MDFSALNEIVGAKYVLTGDDTVAWQNDWTGVYSSTPLAVVRPASTKEVSDVVKWCHTNRVPMVPMSGRTGIVGGGHADGQLVISLDRMNAVRSFSPEAHTISVETGIILEVLNNKLAESDLLFPMTFGAKGSAMIGGLLSTNAGGSNVLKYGNTRDLCLGIEVVLPDGRIMDLMSQLHKDNSGYNLRNLYIGAEGTLGIITAAVLKLVPLPNTFATALIAVTEVEDGFSLLNDLQLRSGGQVEAIEYMSRGQMEGYHRLHPSAPQILSDTYEHTFLVDLGTASTNGDDGALDDILQSALETLAEEGKLLDGVIAQNREQRTAMWAIRESAGEVAFLEQPMIMTDIALPLQSITRFFEMVRPRIEEASPGAYDLSVAHLGDGNIHYCVYPTEKSHLDTILRVIEETVVELRGSFSAEHGVGLSKLASMERLKDPIAIDVMRTLKQALDPENLMNPGKVVPS